MKNYLKQSLVAISILVMSLLPAITAKAALLTSKSITLGTAKVSTSSSYSVSFKPAQTTAIKGIVVDFCMNSPSIGLACTTTNGVTGSPTSGTLTVSHNSQNVNFAVHANSSSSGRLILTHATGLTSVSTSLVLTFSFTATNPSTIGTYYGRILTYADETVADDYTATAPGSHIDDGSVALSTSDKLTLSGTVADVLQFCVGVTVTLDCVSSSGTQSSFGSLNSTSTSTSTHQFAANTNSGTGYAVAILGTTMTSGNNTIPALASPSSSSAGTSQFGLNLRDNSTPDVGTNVSGSGTATPTSNYNTPNLFKFVSGDSVAIASGPTLSNVFTTAYIVNISAAQEAGVYSTTITYVCTALF